MNGKCHQLLPRPTLPNNGHRESVAATNFMRSSKVHLLIPLHAAPKLNRSSSTSFSSRFSGSSAAREFSLTFSTIRSNSSIWNGLLDVVGRPKLNGTLTAVSTDPWAVIKITSVVGLRLQTLRGVQPVGTGRRKP